MIYNNQGGHHSVAILIGWGASCRDCGWHQRADTEAEDYASMHAVRP